MNFCMINSDCEKDFLPFLPEKYRECPFDKNYYVLGIFDEEGPLGAAILYLKDSIMEIRSLEYSDTLKVGDAELALTDFIKNQKFDLYSISYPVGGTKEFLDNYDFLMLDLGYTPSKENVSKYRATLKEVSDSQRVTIDKTMEKEHGHDFKLGSELTKAEIKAYNNLFPNNKYYISDNNKDYSCFFFRNDEIKAGVTLSKTSDGSLEFQWMNAESLPRTYIIKLLVFTASNALSKCSPDTNVIICPFSDEVKTIMKKFGFHKDESRIETRLYSYYL